MEIIVTYGPRRKEKRVKVVTFKVEVDLLEEIDRHAEKRGLSRSELIREAIMRYIRNNGN
ncbi:MAG: ribbon-helix-helix protein, CopG family [Aeropyrum sp.]|nr:ribbon-helix-helix protein, CopG family [Aeropyrum sp.]MCE4615885.1 ribbon-helix-helix protein, CopG family [Aeropyrum sp.]